MEAATVANCKSKPVGHSLLCGIWRKLQVACTGTAGWEVIVSLIVFEVAVSLRFAYTLLI